MKNLKKILLLTLLTCNIYAGENHSTAPTAATESYDATNWAPGSNVESIEAGNVENIIHGVQTGVQINNVVGKYYNRETSEIWGDYEYGLYSRSNNIDPNPFSLLSIENYGNISSDYVVGVNMVGLNGQLNNHTTGYIFGGTVGVQIDGETGESLFNDFGIFNEGIITGLGIGVYKLNVNKNLYIHNTGTIEADNFGIIHRGLANIVNSGTIASYFNTGIYLLDGGTVENTGTIRSVDNRFTSFVDPNSSILSKNALTLKGDHGNYIGNITYNGTDVDASLYAYLKLDNTHTDFKNSRLEDWAFIDVNGGENYFNVEYNFQSYYNTRSEVYLIDGSILHTGDGRTGDANFHIDNGILNPYENNYDDYTSSGSLYWDRYAQQSKNGGQYYDKKEFEKLTVNNLNVGAQGGIVFDFRVSQPYYTTEQFGFPDIDIKYEGNKYPNGQYAGHGYGGWVMYGAPISSHHYQRMNYDKIDVKGSSYIADGATLYIVDHTFETSEENLFTGNYNYKIDLFDGNIRFDDFTNIEFYSSTVGIDHFDNDTGMLHVRLDKFDVNGKNIVDWWLKETSLGFANVPEVPNSSTEQTTSAEEQAAAEAAAQAQAAPMMMMSRMAAPMAMSVESVIESEPLPYEVVEVYNVNITDLAPSTELQQAIYAFTAWEDVDAFLDDLNKVEYASLATSNLNAISNRVDNIYTQLQNDYLRDAKGFSFWFDTYLFDDSLSGSGDHDIDGHGYEVTVGFDKQFNSKFKLGFSFNHIDYSTSVNDSGFHTTIDSEGYGGNVFAQYKQGAVTHTAMLGYGQYSNTDDVISDFDSSEVFTSYRAELAVNKNITLIGGLRYASVKYDDIEVDADNGLKGFTHDSLQTELGVRLSKQFKKLNVNVSASWMHELANAQNSSTAYTSFGEFDQKGIERDADSYRLAVGVNYQLTEKMSVGVEAAKEMSANADSNSVAAKFRISF